MREQPIDYLQANVALWQARQAEQLTMARDRWAAQEPCWGIFSVPETHVGVLPATVDGLDALELGCGTAYVSSWLARLGARPVGLDPTRRATGECPATPTRIRPPLSPRQGGG